MRSRPAKSIIFLLILICLSSAKYSAGESRMTQTYRLVRLAELEINDRQSEILAKEARRSYEKARAMLKLRNRRAAMEYLIISQIIARHSISLEKTNKNLKTIARLSKKLEETKRLHTELKNELASNLSYLQSLKEREAVSKDILSSRAISAIENAQDKVNDAQLAAADELAPEPYTSALDLMKKSNTSFQAGDFIAAINYSHSALEQASIAQEKSIEKVGFKQALLPELSQVYGVSVKETRVGLELRLKDLFTPSGSKIEFDAHPMLDAIIEILKGYPAPRLSISAYARAYKSEEENASLAQTRAMSLRAYLISGGLGKERFIKVEGGAASGKSDPSKSTQAVLSITAALQ